MNNRTFFRSEVFAEFEQVAGDNKRQMIWLSFLRLGSFAPQLQREFAFERANRAIDQKKQKSTYKSHFILIVSLHPFQLSFHLATGVLLLSFAVQLAIELRMLGFICLLVASHPDDGNGKPPFHRTCHRFCALKEIKVVGLKVR
jgi:hypothetical protein